MASLGKRSELGREAEAPRAEAVLELRTRFGRQYCLVRWAGLPAQAATWEPLEELARQGASLEALLARARAGEPRPRALERGAEARRGPGARRKRGRASRRGGARGASAEAEACENCDEESTSAAELPGGSLLDCSVCAEPPGPPVRLGLALPARKIPFDLLEYCRRPLLPPPLCTTFPAPPRGPEAAPRSPGRSAPPVASADSPAKRSSSKKSADRPSELSPKAILSGELQPPSEKPKRTLSSFDSLFAYKPKYSLESLNAFSVQMLNLKHCALRGAPRSFFDGLHKGPDIFSKFRDREPPGPGAPPPSLAAEEAAPVQPPPPPPAPSKPKIRIEYKPLLRCESDRVRQAPIPNQPTASLFGRTQAAASSNTLL